MKLTIGSIYLNKDEPNFAELSSEQGVVKQIPLGDENPSIEAFSPYLDQIDEVVVGFVNQPDMNFLKFLPNVTSVWIITSTVKKLDGLRYLKNLRSFAIDRPTCRMDVLGELSSLEELYLDDWRPGAKSVFRLNNLVKVGIQKFGYSNLQGISGWTRLNELWFNAGKLESLNGIPASIKSLRLTNLRKLDSLLPLSNCPELEDLRIEGCRKIDSLQGIEMCFHLKILSIAKGGIIQGLSPLRELKSLEQLLIGDGTEIQNDHIDVLYALPILKKVIIPKNSGVNRDRLLATNPNCEITLIG